MGVIFYIYFYKSVTKTSHSKDKLQSAIHVILKGQEQFSEVSDIYIRKDIKMLFIIEMKYVFEN